MDHLDQNKTALTVGLFIGGWHVLWSVLVAIGAGQMLWELIMWAHMIHIPVTVGPFNVGASLVLVVVTFCIGYVFGSAFAYLWNRLPRVVTS